MSDIVTQKSQLAKLLASENLFVEHKNVPTAYFDLATRTLALPIWKDMDANLYDMLCGHEVGHALYTPLEGWHNTVSEKINGDSNFKHFLNVVEDARIEKKIQRRFPGLRSSFKNAFQDVAFNRDFFGIKDKDINEFLFIDRLNIFTKSQYTLDTIRFSDEELKIIERVKNIETWDEVVSLAKEIYAMCKRELQEQKKEKVAVVNNAADNTTNEESPEEETQTQNEEDSSNTDSGENEQSNPEKTEESESVEETEAAAGGNGTSDEENEEEETPESESVTASGSEEETDEDGEDEATGNQSSHGTEGFDEINEEDIRCLTDEKYRENEITLVDQSSSEYHYVNLPKPDLAKIITPASRVQEILTNYYVNGVDVDYRFSRNKPDPVLIERMNAEVREFKNKNDRFVSLLAKEFEMRKAAKAFSRNRISDTGEIDINKLANYKIDDNIFRKIMSTPNGKKHGLILLLDYSGSMNRNMSGSIEQIIVLTMFCRKVNIPFRVFSFHDVHQVRELDADGKLNSVYNCFSNENNELIFKDVFLREYLNSNMNNREYSTAIRNMILLRKSFEGEQYYKSYGRPSTEHLSGTPMIEAVYACGFIMEEFRRKHALDITNLVIVHDGDASPIQSYIKLNKNNYKTTVHMDKKNDKYFVRDTSIKFDYRLDPIKFNSVQNAVFSWFKKKTNSDIIGFFIIRNNKYNILSVFNTSVDASGKRIPHTEQDEVEFMNFIRKNKYGCISRENYKEFFLILGGKDLDYDDEGFEVSDNATVRKIQSEFKKYNEKRIVNRVLVNRFISGIAL